MTSAEADRPEPVGAAEPAEPAEPAEAAEASEVDRLVEMLGRVPLFRPLGREAIVGLVNRSGTTGTGGTLEVAAGQQVCAEGEPGSDMFVVLGGTLTVSKGQQEEQVSVATLGAGDFFGELSMLDGEPRTATVVCEERAQLFVIDRAAFAELVVEADNPEVALVLIATMAERVRTTTQRFVEDRLAQRLLETEIEADRHRALTQMVAGVAHELNTPLGVANTAIGIVAGRIDSGPFTELAADGADRNDDLTRVLEDIEEATGLAVRNIQRANRLIDSFKQVSVNIAASEPRSVELAAVVADVVELFSITARRANLSVEIIDRLEDGAGGWVGDPGHLHQILTNLLANVERHAYRAGAGGVVRITLRGSGEQRAVEVADDGCGIDEATLAQIFTPFFTTARSAGGSGLGLAIVAGLVRDALGGTVSVSSTVDLGTTFVVEFPQRSPAADRVDDG